MRMTIPQRRLFLTRVTIVCLSCNENHSYPTGSNNPHSTLLRSLFRFENLLLSSGFISPSTSNQRTSCGCHVADHWYLTSWPNSVCSDWHFLLVSPPAGDASEIFNVKYFPKAQVLDQTVGHRLSVWKLQSQSTAKPHLCPQNLERVIDAFITSRLKLYNYGGWGLLPLLQI